MRNFSLILIALVAFAFSGCKKESVSTVGSATIIATNHLSAGVKVIRLTNGKYVAAIQELDNSNFCLLIATDKNGKELWRREFGAAMQTLKDVQPTNDSGIIIVSINDATQNQLFLTALSQDGNTRYTANVVAPDNFNLRSAVLGVENDNAADLFVSYSYYKDSPIHKMEFIKFDNGGNLAVRTNIITDSAYVYNCYQITNTPAGYLIAGYFRSGMDFRASGFIHGTFAASFTRTGIKNWLKLKPAYVIEIDGGHSAVNFNGNSILNGSGGYVTQAGITTTMTTGIVFLRSFPLIPLGNATPQNIGELAVINSDPVTGDSVAGAKFKLLNQANRTVSCNTNDNGSLLAVTDNAYTFDSYYPAHTTLLKLDKNLKEQWRIGYDFPYSASPFGIFQEKDGGYTIFLIANSFNTQTDLAIIKTDATGKLR